MFKKLSVLHWRSYKYQWIRHFCYFSLIILYWNSDLKYTHSKLQNMHSASVPCMQYALECLLSSRQGLSKGSD